MGLLDAKYAKNNPRKIVRLQKFCRYNQGLNSNEPAHLQLIYEKGLELKNFKFSDGEAIKAYFSSFGGFKSFLLKPVSLLTPSLALAAYYM